jgi:hypothetical protein
MEISLARSSALQIGRTTELRKSAIEKRLARANESRYPERMTGQTVTIQIAQQTAAMLQARADAQGVSLDELLRLLFEAPNGKQENTDALLDWEYIAECAAEADPSVTLEEVRAVLSKIPGSMVEDFRRERDER